MCLELAMVYFKRLERDRRTDVRMSGRRAYKLGKRNVIVLVHVIGVNV